MIHVYGTIYLKVQPNGHPSPRRGWIMTLAETQNAMSHGLINVAYLLLR